MEDYNHLKIHLEDVKAATNDFDGNNRIGGGGFGSVYKGKLSYPKGQKMVAFKCLDSKFGQGNTEFWKEIVMLSKCKHENLVSLLHFCNEGSQKIIVYEYVSNGSLDRYLSDASLTWVQRLNICVGVAHALNYLHDPKGTHERVLHRDIKSSNILLDENWTAKVSDFGLSKFGPANQEQTYVVTNPVGTLGYGDPLYFKEGFLGKESDVYSFGVVMFEVLCGRLCCEYRNHERPRILVPEWVRCYKENKLDEIILPGLKEQMKSNSLDTFSAIAYRCLKEAREERPTMEEIVKELEMTVEQQLYQFKIPFGDIRSATDDFSPNKIIGRGGFGKAYKGELSFMSRRSMAVFKRLDHNMGQGDPEFWQEITILSQYKHENLVSLRNFCTEDDEKILVYKYASRGSLDCHLSDTSLTWIQRLKICVGVARALNYLHNPIGTLQTVLHRDIKSANILLDENWIAKVSDFGLSKVAPANQKNMFLISNVVGTVGYCDPSYVETGFLTKESDVYSFGVVLFEVLCGRLYLDNSDVQTLFLVPVCKKCYKENTLDEIILSGLKEQMEPSSLDMFSTIAYRCLKRDREERPTMAQIMKELEMALEQQERFEVLRKKVDFEELKRVADLVVPPLSYTSQNQLPIRFLKGILVDDGKTWLSMHENGKIGEMISATKCIYGDSLVSHAEYNSRFSNVFWSNQDGFKVEVKTRFLSPHVTYTINLVFRPNSFKLSIHIPLKYKLDEETNYSNSCIAHMREDGWQMVELYQFTNRQRKQDFRIEFVPQLAFNSTMLRYLLEGIEFRPVEYETHENLEHKNKVDMQPISNSDATWEQILPADYRDIIKLSKDSLQWKTKKELYFLLRKGFLIDNEEKWFSISKTMKKRLMIPANTFLTETEWIWNTLPESRFEMVAACPNKNSFWVHLRTKSIVLSPHTTYSCHLIYKVPENSSLLEGVIVMNFTHPDYTFGVVRDPGYIYLITPPHTPIIGHKVGIRKIKGHPKLRKDGWMKFQFMETSTDTTGSINMSIEFSCYDKNKSNFVGLVVQSIEFRPL